MKNKIIPEYSPQNQLSINFFKDMTSTSSQDGITRTWLALMQQQQKVKQNVWKIVFKTRRQAIKDSVPWGIGDKWCEPCSCCSSLSWDNLQEGKLRWRPGRFTALRRWSWEGHEDSKLLSTWCQRGENDAERESSRVLSIVCMWGGCLRLKERKNHYKN